MTDFEPSYMRRLDDEGERKSALAFTGKLFQEDVIILRRSMAELQSELVRLDALCKQLRHEREILIARSEQFELDLNAIKKSSSWQITRPLRALFSLHPDLARLLRRAFKLMR
jgi:hypothetical protein